MQEHTHDKNCSHEVVVKGRTEGASTLTTDQMQQMITNLLGGGDARINPLLTSEQILEKRKLRLQENAKKRRTRKSVRNKALAVVKSKRGKRRAKRGATAQELQVIVTVTPYKRSRTLRRETARNMAKLSRKFSTKSPETGQVTEAVEL